MRRLLALAVAVLVVAWIGVSIASSAPSETRWSNTYTTGYSYWDNNPPGSADICCPSLHTQAAGTGTFADPLTVAVDYSNGRTMQFAAGTKFYIPNLRAYLIVEDRTGEQQASNTRHTGADPHLDIWVDGRTSSSRNADNCMSQLTDTGRLVIQNPASNYLVVAGPISANNSCRPNFGNTVVTAGSPPTTLPVTTTTRPCSG